MAKMIGNEKGFVLVTSYFLIAALAIFSLGLMFRGITFLQSSEKNRNNIVAFNMAEAGLDLAIGQLATSTTYGGSSGFVSMDTGNMEGGYSVVVCPPNCTGLSQPTNTNVRLIQSTGYSPSNDTTVRGYQERTVTGYVNIAPTSKFNYALFAGQAIAMSGNAQTDSYNSNNGAYGGSNIFSGGHVGSDGASGIVMALSGNAMIKGNAEIGPGGSTAANIGTSGNAVITGTKSVSTSTKNYQPETTTLPSSGALVISGNSTVTLAAGTYNYSSISVSGNGKLKTTGAVTLYVSGNVSISGNGVTTASNKPSNFLLYSTGTGSVSFSGNASFYGAVYAPKSAVTNSGNGEIFGAIVSKTYAQSGNGKIHFDEALKSGSTGSTSNVSALSWVEKNTAAA